MTTSGVKTLSTVTPPRSLARDFLINQYNKLLDAACDLEDSLASQEGRMRKGSRHGLNPKVCNRKVKSLVAAANKCLELAPLLNRVDENGKYILDKMPPLPGEDLLCHQDIGFLQKLGRYHKLYIGKYKKMYGRLGR